LKPITYTLRVYRAPSGQLSGTLLDGDIEVCGVAGCATVAEVEEAIIEQGYESYKLFIPFPLN
jgi:hypothetical protein